MKGLCRCNSGSSSADGDYHELSPGPKPLNTEEERRTMRQNMGHRGNQRSSKCGKNSTCLCFLEFGGKEHMARNISVNWEGSFFTASKEMRLHCHRPIGLNSENLNELWSGFISKACQKLMPHWLKLDFNLVKPGVEHSPFVPELVTSRTLRSQVSAPLFR